MAAADPSGRRAARFDGDVPAVVIEHLAVNHPAVVSEARHWSAGRRGAAVSTEDMTGADLSTFVTQALAVGAQAIGTAGGVQETFSIAALMTEVAERSAQASEQAAGVTKEAVDAATTTMAAASAAARLAITEAGSTTRQAFTAEVDAARKALAEEINRLVGGEAPELLARLAPLLDRFGRDLDHRSLTQTSELIDRVVRQFDPADPASPMGQHTRALAQQHLSLTEAMTRNHQDLGQKVDELTRAVEVARAAEGAATATIRSTPLKGETYAASVHRVLAGVAAGLGDDYTDTSATTGQLLRSKKGDGVLAVAGGGVHVVLEMSDSNRGGGWGAYLEEAERNRSAVASLGLVRSTSQLNGSGVLCLGPRRIVMAFDPDVDGPDLLRTVVQLLRLSATAAAAREDAGDLHTAEELIADALRTLTKIDDITRAAGLIKQHAGTIDDSSDSLRTQLSRLLSQAQSALAGAARATVGDAAA